ncbi:DUF4436 family protein [Longispora sp. K20-0274]|uniref:DUF4436 family protein n=1 Tax=Longispora sp. K20-0274 TaxID=3088255 RepID=UPI00399B90A6
MTGRRLLRPAVVVLVAVVVAGLGLWLQVGERLAIDTRYTAGGEANPDRVDVEASVQRVDAAGRELILRVLVTPRGRLGEDGEVSPTEDLVLQTSSSVRGDLTYRAHARITTVDLPVALTDGAITDYPFDRYRATIAFAGSAGGRAVPVRMTLSNNDALFTPHVRASEEGGVPEFELRVDRSGSVLIFAVLMMAAMWTLAVAVVIGTWFLVTRRRGLVWPALGWMAATLFALAAFRNTAPGSPPIGSLLDYLAFLWVETVIAVCVIVTVVAGARAEPRT